MSIDSSDLSQASTKLDSDSLESSAISSKTSSAHHKIRYVATHAQDVLLFLIAFRVLNALSVITFFQPDEFFQSLEPAWQIVFGRDSGAWMTWEWRNHLRSSIHPTIFAGAYYISNLFARLLQLPPASTADLLIAAPRTLQAIFAALQDFYTWKLAQKIFGTQSNESWAALALSVVSPWQWFCSTRTFSNGLETTLTIVALYFWPWHWIPKLSSEDPRDERDRRQEAGVRDPASGRGWKLILCLLLAALACVLRPTNVLVWIPLAFSVMFEHRMRSFAVPIPKVQHSFWVNLIYPSVRRDNQAESIALIELATICGGFVLVLSALVDRLFYGVWTFPPLKFLLFNVVQSLAVFYGRNDWHYYLSQGLPLLLTTALPFALVALAQGSLLDHQNSRHQTMRQMTIICLILPGVLSLMSHKEVRFIYPLLPILHIITAPVLSSFFGPAISPPPSRSFKDTRSVLLRRGILAFLLSVNALLAFYTTQIHAPGPLNALSYLRTQYIRHYAPSPDTNGVSLLSPNTSTPVMSVGFLMPCHSTPWRSHLVFPYIDAWALTCEPPLHHTPTEKSTYLDEADQFYENPTLWIRTHMSRHPPRPNGIFSHHPIVPQRRSSPVYSTSKVNTKRTWPDYLVFFEQLETTMDVLLRGSGYAECWRGWNTHWHDDWRRKGDVIVWCLHPERRTVGDDYRQNSTWKSLSKTLESAKLLVNSALDSKSKKPSSWIPSFKTSATSRGPAWSWPGSRSSSKAGTRWYQQILGPDKTRGSKKVKTKTKKPSSKAMDLWS